MTDRLTAIIALRIELSNFRQRVDGELGTALLKLDRLEREERECIRERERALALKHRLDCNGMEQHG